MRASRMSLRRISMETAKTKVAHGDGFGFRFFFKLRQDRRNQLKVTGIVSISHQDSCIIGVREYSPVLDLRYRPASLFFWFDRE
jgi:hypothetical protein